MGKECTSQFCRKICTHLCPICMYTHEKSIVARVRDVKLDLSWQGSQGDQSAVLFPTTPSSPPAVLLCPLSLFPPTHGFLNFLLCIHPINKCKDIHPRLQCDEMRTLLFYKCDGVFGSGVIVVRRSKNASSGGWIVVLSSRGSWDGLELNSWNHGHPPSAKATQDFTV